MTLSTAINFKYLRRTVGMRHLIVLTRVRLKNIILETSRINQSHLRIKDMYNQPDNADGSKIKIILGSPSIKEGVSLLRVSEVHILEPYWNMSRLDQVIGRAVRFCSHKDLPKSKRHVDIFIYIADHPKEKMSIDKYILNMAYKKNEIIKQFEKALKESAVDCKLNIQGNVYSKQDTLKCKNN